MTKNSKIEAKTALREAVLKIGSMAQAMAYAPEWGAHHALRDGLASIRQDLDRAEKAAVAMGITHDTGNPSVTHSIEELREDRERFDQWKEDHLSRWSYRADVEPYAVQMAYEAWLARASLPVPPAPCPGAYRLVDDVVTCRLCGQSEEVHASQDSDTTKGAGEA